MVWEEGPWTCHQSPVLLCGFDKFLSLKTRISDFYLSTDLRTWTVRANFQKAVSNMVLFHVTSWKQAKSLRLKSTTIRYTKTLKTVRIICIGLFFEEMLNLGFWRLKEKIYRTIKTVLNINILSEVLLHTVQSRKNLFYLLVVIVISLSI
jgi:hypothetical protein